ncbi:ATP-binding cassette domain-containing protein [Deefgea tanakiae]|uniref:ATP-binding cassette domain-containing protein n=1 Tax=Deefgea tanakiae TaxID=2865840 RepID=A0ABX8Z229_9NEIS|nr:ATP-binding cassette domain-containing protein [Deefgea tanakiae]QZA76633.1 ATP-binding cassette domain-containing protein [Deefgea tanakiae]
MSTYLNLNQLSLVLPDGRRLFSNLNYSFSAQRTGLVGNNGVGKSLLGAIMAGEVLPTSGTIHHTTSIHHTRQVVDPVQQTTVAALAGVEPILRALERISNGCIDELDYQIVGHRWDCEQELAFQLEQIGLGHLKSYTPTAQLSGGERQRVMLLGAFNSNHDYLILDEPSNHLDRRQKQVLSNWIKASKKGLLLISHDRELLELVDEIVELRADGIACYGGGYSDFAQIKSTQQQALQADLHAERTQAKREHKAMIAQLERQQRRSAQGGRIAKEGNQAKIILDAQHERSQHTTGKMLEQQQERRADSLERIASAKSRCAPVIQHLLLPPESTVGTGTQVLQLVDLVLPFGSCEPLNAIFSGPCRIAVHGDNGSGKSTLLKVIAGEIQPKSGQALSQLNIAWLDQHAGAAYRDQTPVQCLQSSNPNMSETESHRVSRRLFGLSQTNTACSL